MGVGQANRWPALALAGAAHCGAVLALLALTRVQIIPRTSEASPLLVTFFMPRAARPDRPASGNRRAVTGQKRERQASRPDQASASPEAEPPEGPEAIDWSLEAEAAGTRAAARDRRERRQRERFAPPRNDTFTPPASKAEFPWHHARTHRVEPLEGGGSLINLNDNFVLVVLGMIPFPTCKLGRIPARGDLFDHMRDIPESRSWKDR